MSKGCYIPVLCDDCDKAPTIGENGNWFIGDQDTGVKAQGEDGESGAKGDKGDPGVPGAPGAQGQAGSFANMDVLFEGRANTIGITHNLLKPITDYKVIIVEYGFSKSAPATIYGTSFEWIVNPQISSNIRDYRGIRMIEPGDKEMLRNVIYWNFPTATTFVVGERAVYFPDETFGITKIYGIK